MTDIVLPGKTAAILTCDQILREMERLNPARARAIRIVRMHLARIEKAGTSATDAYGTPNLN